MSIDRLLTQTATITDTPKADTDAEGNWTPGEPDTTTVPCRLQDGATDELFEGENRITADALLFLPAGAAIGGRSEVIVDDKRYQVVGRPAELRTPRGPHHLEVHLRRIDG